MHDPYTNTHTNMHTETLAIERLKFLKKTSAQTLTRTHERVRKGTDANRNGTKDKVAKRISKIQKTTTTKTTSINMNKE